MAFSGFVAVRLALPEDGPIDFEVNVFIFRVPDVFA